MRWLVVLAWSVLIQGLVVALYVGWLSLLVAGPQRILSGGCLLELTGERKVGLEGQQLFPSCNWLKMPIYSLV
jgi:hypothetical protein